MKSHAICTRIVLVVLVALLALLALPIAQTASPVEAKNRSRIVTKTFANAAAITLPGSALAAAVSRRRSLRLLGGAGLASVFAAPAAANAGMAG